MVKQIINLLSSNGYAIGLGVEAAIALIAGVLLILLLANVFAKRERAADADGEATRSSSVVVEESEPAAVVAEESPVEIIREINTVYVPVMGQEPAQEPAPAAEPEVQAEPVAAVAESPAAENNAQQQQPIIINVFGNTEEKPAEPAPSETVVVVEGDGVKFHENKTIEELYEELSVEQRSFFDELKNTALAKPNAVLSITKTYENVKIGKRSIIKLLIRRGVTVAEFLLENDALKEYRLSSQNKKGKSKIKIRPTVIAVTELDTLRAAVDMIHLAYEQIIEE